MDFYDSIDWGLVISIFSFSFLMSFANNFSQGRFAHRIVVLQMILVICVAGVWLYVRPKDSRVAMYLNFGIGFFLAFVADLILSRWISKK